MNQPNGTRQATLVDRALDRNRLLAGEDPDSLQAEDAIHWSAVYWELIEFKQVLLAQMRKGLRQLPTEAANEIRTVDMAIIRKQLERYEACRAFWEHRGELLARDLETVRAVAEGRQNAKELAGKRPGAAH